MIGDDGGAYDGWRADFEKNGSSCFGWPFLGMIELDYCLWKLDP
jgi:hypothetical protein